jgi:hypothetical protein
MRAVVHRRYGGPDVLARADTIPLSAVTSPLWMPCVNTGRERANADARPAGTAATMAPAAPALISSRQSGRSAWAGTLSDARRRTVTIP